MATLTDLQAKIAEVKAIVTAEKAEVAAKFQALRDQIAAGGTVTPAQLDALIVDVNAIGTGIGAISDEPVVVVGP